MLAQNRKMSLWGPLIDHRMGGWQAKIGILAMMIVGPIVTCLMLLYWLNELDGLLLLLLTSGGS